MPRAFKHPWYKHKGYLHFDFALTQSEAESYAMDPGKVERHRFSPLIHYLKMSRKVSRNKDAEQAYKNGFAGKPKLIVKEKPRNIFYNSHIDGYIYSYYAYKLGEDYENFLKQNELTDNVIAYRAISKNEISLCNIHFAQEAFAKIEAMDGANIVCFDISKFFDKLSVAVLKDNWELIIGEARLPNDHFKVFKSLTEFRYIEEGKLIERFRDRFRINPRQHGISKDIGGSSKNRICSYTELRPLLPDCLKNKEKMKITGIPQGTAMSGLLSNIFMIHFDIAVKKFVEGNGGCYRRYSDDIFICVPRSIDFSAVEAFVKEKLNEFCGNSIELNKDKTERRVYRLADGGAKIIAFEDGVTPAKVQYLGFHFDGESVFIRNSSISKDRGKTVQLIRKNKKKGCVINTTDVYKRKSARVVTPYDDLVKKGFAYYAVRSDRIHSALSGISEQIQKTDRFIKRAVKRERQREPRR